MLKNVNLNSIVTKYNIISYFLIYQDNVDKE